MADDKKIDDKNPDKADELKQLQAYHNNVAHAERIVATTEREWSDAKSVAAARKADYDAAVVDLCEIARRDPSDRGMFDHLATPADTGKADANAWKAVATKELATHGVKPAIMAKLHAVNLDTLGQLQGYMTKHAQAGGMATIEGIGDAVADTIGDAMAAWFRANPTKCPPH